MENVLTIPESWVSILEKVASGETLKTQAYANKLNYRQLLNEIKKNPELATAYEQAETAAADEAVDEIMTVINEIAPAGMNGSDASAWANKQKLRVETLKWYAAKLSKKWSEKTIVEQTNYVVDIKGLLEQREKQLDKVVSEITVTKS